MIQLLIFTAMLIPQDVNRFGQVKAVSVDRTIRVTPTLVLPGLFIQGYGVTINPKQLRANRSQRRHWRRFGRDN